MRENRQSGSEGGGAEANRLFLPLFEPGGATQGRPWTIPGGDWQSPQVQSFRNGGRITRRGVNWLRTGNICSALFVT